MAVGLPNNTTYLGLKKSPPARADSLLQKTYVQGGRLMVADNINRTKLVGRRGIEYHAASTGEGQNYVRSQ